MRAATSIALIALLAVPALAIPVSVTEEPPVEEPTTEPTTSTSSSGGSTLGHDIITSAAGGAAGAAVSNLLSKIESLFRRSEFDVHDEDLYVKRDVNDLGTIISQAQSLSASDKATVKTALMNKIGTLQSKRDEPSLEARVTSAVKPAAAKPASSSSGLGGAVASSVAGGAASAVVGNLLGELEKLFRRDDFELEARGGFDEPILNARITSGAKPVAAKPASSSSGLGGALASSVAGGAASAAVSNLLGELEKLFRRDDSGLEARGGIGGALASSAAGGAASAVVGNLLTEIEKLFRRTDTKEGYAKRDVSSIGDIITQAQTLSASDKATVKTALMNKISTLQSRKEDVMMKLHSMQRCAPKSSLGGSIASSVAGGAASGLVGNLLNEIESLFRRSEDYEIDELD